MNNRRGPGRPFQAGNKHGKGRPAGSRNKATIALEVLLDGEGDAIMHKVIELAKAGSETAIRLCIDRLVPPRRERVIRLQLPSDLTTAQGTARAVGAVIKALSQGEITPGEATQIVSILEVRRKAIETQVLESRMEKVELNVELSKQTQSGYDEGCMPDPVTESPG
jgi:hypothetical protein